MEDGQIQMAQGRYQAAMTVARSNNDRQCQAAALNNLGIVHREKAKGKREIPHPLPKDYFEQALKLNEDLGDLRCLAQNLVNLGCCFLDERSLGRWNFWHLHSALTELLVKARDKHKEALQILRKVGTRTEIETVNHNLWVIDEAFKFINRTSSDL